MTKAMRCAKLNQEFTAVSGCHGHECIFFFKPMWELEREKEECGVRIVHGQVTLSTLPKPKKNNLKRQLGP